MPARGRREESGFAVMVSRLRPLLGAAVVTYALTACAQVPAHVAGQFQADDDPERNHYLRADLEEQTLSDDVRSIDQ